MHKTYMQKRFFMLGINGRLHLQDKIRLSLRTDRQNLSLHLHTKCPFIYKGQILPLGRDVSLNEEITTSLHLTYYLNVVVCTHDPLLSM